MLFSIVLILAVLVVAFFHYLQGLFSATISAILTVLAAAIAVAWHEWIVENFLAGKYYGSIHAMMLIIVFAVIYLVLRLLFDKAVPGNVRVPAIVDKVGGGVMGVIAGVFAVGLVAIAAQQMPFGPSIAGFSRYEADDETSVYTPGGAGGRRVDAYIYDQMTRPRFEEEARQSLLLPVDGVVVSAVEHLSDRGARSAGKPPK